MKKHLYNEKIVVDILASEVEKTAIRKGNDSNLFLRKSYVVIWKEGCCIDGDVRRLKGRKYEKRLRDVSVKKNGYKDY